jgi:hypothetical protein
MIRPLASDFQSTGYVYLPGLLRTEIFGHAFVEMMELMQRAKRRHFMMTGFETERRLATVGGQVIRSVAPGLVNVYSNAQLRSLLVVLTGGEVRPCAHPQEFMVANFLSEPGDTHGWHVDDPPYALILFFESPAVGHGGELEFIPSWHRFCVTRSIDPYHAVERSVDLARREGLVEIRHHEGGDAYLLRADKCLHRVTPLTAGDNRSVINMAFEADLEVDYGETASRLYDEGSDQEGGGGQLAAKSVRPAFSGGF